MKVGIYYDQEFNRIVEIVSISKYGETNAIVQWTLDGQEQFWMVRSIAENSIKRLEYIGKV